MGRLISVMLGVGALMLALAITAPANAQLRPQASLVPIHAKITAGTKPEFTYTTSNLPNGSVEHVQRRFGTAQVWTNVAQVQGSTGTYIGSQLAMGKYVYRLHVTRNGVTVVNSPSTIVYSYGTIPYHAFCLGMDSSYSCELGNEQVGSTVLSYAGTICADRYPTYCSENQSASTSCRSITLRYASGDAANDTAYLEVIQARSDPQYAQVAPNTIGVFKARLDGGAVYINGATTNRNPIRVAGSASCYTSNGRK